MTTTKTRSRPTKATATSVDHPFLTAFRSGMGVVESTVVGLAEFPLGVARSFGVPEATTDKIRQGHTSLIHGFGESLDTLATGLTDVAGKQAGVFTDLLGTVSRSTKS
jgi:Na+/H+-translocating membrane pyrophosphatase